MAEVVNVNFKLDSDVKKKMESACADMGLSMSAAFTIFFAKKSAGSAGFLLRFPQTLFIPKAISAI